MKGIFGPHVLWPLGKKLIFWIVTCVSARDYTVPNQQIKVHPISWQYPLINYLATVSAALPPKAAQKELVSEMPLTDHGEMLFKVSFQIFWKIWMYIFYILSQLKKT